MHSTHLYAETPGLRTRQLLADMGVALWVFLWVRSGIWLHALIERLEEPGREMEEAGTRIAGWRVPVLDLRLGPVISGGEFLQRAGESQQDSVHVLAVWLAVILAGIPVMWLLVRYLPRRVQWVREARAAGVLRSQASAQQLFALRALVNRPLAQLRKVEPDPAGAYVRGDYAALAALELSYLGLLPAPATEPAP